MKSNSLVSLILLVLITAIGCGDKGSSSPNPNGTHNQSALPNGSSLPTISGDNVMKITVNGSLCSSNSYLNKPCVSVKICVPGSSNCQVINDILLDTGSYGLRVFKSALNGLSLPYLTSGPATLAECAQFGSGSDWGPVANADVILANEPAVQVPIHLIDSTFANGSTYCSGADKGPEDAGFNGILGVGLFQSDCSLVCSVHSGNKTYYACTGTTCVSTKVSVANQVRNPVALLPQDNNGVLVRFPSIDIGGAPSVDGYLILGIGTRENNQPLNVQAFKADPQTGDAITTFNGTSFVSFLDTGSNGIVFADPSKTPVPTCGKNLPGFFCPASVVDLSASFLGFQGSPSASISFQIGNALDLTKSSNRVFVEVGETTSNFFDWGLPFHLGRNVYVGFETKSSPLGTGPYWAF
jgi:hypothetical protein